MPSPPKMRFLIDENVRKEVADFLRLGGHDVLISTSGAKDEEVARIAKQTKRMILTHDQHFADILMYPPEEYSGIIRIKIHPPNAPTIINALKDLVFNTPIADKTNRFKAAVSLKSGRSLVITIPEDTSVLCTTARRW